MKTRRDLLPDSCSKCRFVEWKLDVGYFNIAKERIEKIR